MAGKKIAVDFFYDIISPYSYLGFEQICRYRTQWSSMQLRFRPFYLGGVMKGSENKPPLVVPNKAKYMPRDLKNLSQYHEIPLKMPRNFIEIAMSKDAIKMQRFLTSVDMNSSQKDLEELSREMWKRIFWTHKDVLTIESFREAGKDAKVDSNVVEKAIQEMESVEVKDRLKNVTNEAIDYDAFGAPSIVVHCSDKPQLVFGSDRIEIVGMLLGEKKKKKL
jgi:glutathione S-transferase kappa 1